MSPADALRLLLLSSLWGLSFIFMRVAVPEFGPAPAPPSPPACCACAVRDVA